MTSNPKPAQYFVSSERRLEEFRKAGERILAQRGVYGGPRPAALVWLLTMVQEDTAHYSFGDWTNRWGETKRFASDGGLGADLDEEPLSNVAAAHIRLQDRFRNPFTALRPDPGPGEKETYLFLQAELKVDLETYLERGWARTGGVVVDLIVNKTFSRVAVISDLHPAFMYQAYHLIAEFGPRIRKCRGCARLFLAGRIDKKYCTGLCQANTYKREHSIRLHKGGSHAKHHRKKGGPYGTKKHPRARRVSKKR